MDNKVISYENDFAEVFGLFREIESSLIVLQQAVQIEDGMVTHSNIDYNLELINGRFSVAIKKFANACDKQFTDTQKNQTTDLVEHQ